MVFDTELQFIVHRSKSAGVSKRTTYFPHQLPEVPAESNCVLVLESTWTTLTTQPEKQYMDIVV